MGIKQTGKVVTYTSVNVDKIVDGLIVEHNGAVNLFESLLKIRAIKIISDDKYK